MAVSRINEAGLNVNQYGNRNLIINGAMQIAQRSTSSTSTGLQTLDRFSCNVVNTDEAAFTQAQSSLAPSGFTNSFRVDCTTVESALAANEYANVLQPIEAQNLQHLQNGSSDAKSLTLSFYVKSSKTGTYGFNLYKPDNTARQITSTYSISAADTWEYKTVTFAGDTTGGGISNDTGGGLYLYWHLAAGSDFTSSDSTSWSNYANAGFAYGHAVNLFDNTANDWAITGVQLEVGDTATDFEHRSFADELAKCQRYYHKINAATAYSTLGTAALSTATTSTIYPFAGFNLRAVPTLESSGVSTFLLQCNNANESVSALSINGHASKQAPICSCTHDSSTAGFAGSLSANNNASAYIAFSSEL